MLNPLIAKSDTNVHLQVEVVHRLPAGPLPACSKSSEGFFNEGAVQALIKSFKFQMHEVIMPVN